MLVLLDRRCTAKICLLAARQKKPKPAAAQAVLFFPLALQLCTSATYHQLATEVERRKAAGWHRLQWSLVKPASPWKVNLIFKLKLEFHLYFELSHFCLTLTALSHLKELTLAEVVNPHISFHI